MALHANTAERSAGVGSDDGHRRIHAQMNATAGRILLRAAGGTGMTVRPGIARNGDRQPKRVMVTGRSAAPGFAAVFASLRAVLEPYAKEPGFVHIEGDGMYQLSSTRKT